MSSQGPEGAMRRQRASAVTRTDTVRMGADAVRKGGCRDLRRRLSSLPVVRVRQRGLQGFGRVPLDLRQEKEDAACGRSDHEYCGADEHGKDEEDRLVRHAVALPEVVAKPQDEQAVHDVVEDREDGDSRSSGAGRDEERFARPGLAESDGQYCKRSAQRGECDSEDGKRVGRQNTTD